MKFGLIRHFPVKRGFPKKFMLSTGELAQWLEEYEASDILEGTIDLQGIPWQRCYTSDLPRAARTAGIIFHGEIVSVKELHEIGVFTFPKAKFKLPFFIWAIAAKLIFRVSKKAASETIVDLKKRINAFLDMALSRPEQDVLIVSHGVLLEHMRKELISRGFKGPRFGTPVNGKLYIFER